MISSKPTTVVSWTTMVSYGRGIQWKSVFCPSTPSILHGALAGCWVHSGLENVQPNELCVLPCVRVSLEREVEPVEKKGHSSGCFQQTMSTKKPWALLVLGVGTCSAKYSWELVGALFLWVDWEREREREKRSSVSWDVVCNWKANKVFRIKFCKFTS